MKRLLSVFLAVAAILSCVTVLAAEEPEEYAIVVDGQELDLSGLPVGPYKEGDTVMVPLRKIGEALGYKVDWNAEIQAITVDDEYIQKAILFDGTAKVVFEGRLQIINMSREIENKVPTVVHDGYTYVPFEFFTEFLNDAEMDGAKINIAPSKCEAY